MIQPVGFKFRETECAPTYPNLPHLAALNSLRTFSNEEHEIHPVDMPTVRPPE